MWIECFERFLWRNPRAPVTQVIPEGVHFVKKAAGLAAIAAGHAKAVPAPYANNVHVR